MTTEAWRALVHERGVPVRRAVKKKGVRRVVVCVVLPHPPRVDLRMRTTWQHVAAHNYSITFDNLLDSCGVKVPKHTVNGYQKAFAKKTKARSTQNIDATTTNRSCTRRA